MLLIVTVALARLVLSTSLTVKPVSMAVAGLFSVYANVLPVAVTTGASSTAVTLIVRVAVPLRLPSLAEKVMVRLAVLGLSEVFW